MADNSKDHSKMLTNRLGQAIHNDDLEHVRIYIEQGADVNKPCYLEMYGEMHPLAIACRRGHEEVMEELLNAGADPNQLSVWRPRPAMFMAAERRVLTLSMMRCLISYGADVNFRGYTGKTILHILACGRLHDTDDNILSAVKLLSENGASFSARDWDDYTPLYEACRSGNIDLVKLFIAEGADVNFDIGGKTMLRWEADRCNLDMFELLLNAGANRYLTPDAVIESCAGNDHALIARILDTCNVDINMPLDHFGGMTILHYACRVSYRTFIHACDIPSITSETVRLLLDRGADVRAVSDTGDTALHYAVEDHDCNKIRQLLTCNPPLNIKNNNNQTPFLNIIHCLIGIQPASSFSSLYRNYVLIFKMCIAAADSKVTNDVKQELIQLRTILSEAQRPDFEFSSKISLHEMCRSVIRGTIRVPVDSNVCKLPIPKRLQEYLRIAELDSIVDEYIKM